MLFAAAWFLGFVGPVEADFCADKGYLGGSHTVCHFRGPGIVQDSVEDIAPGSTDQLDVIRPSPAIIVRRKDYMHIYANPCEVWCHR